MSKFQNDSIIGYLMGGLGNQLFIIATTYAYSLEHNKKFYLTKSWKGISKSRPFYWNTLLKNISREYLVEPYEIDKFPRYEEPTFAYTKIPIFNQNQVLYGYFQSPKYFEKYESEIRKLFELPEELMNFANNKLMNLQDKTLVMVHIRHGDYKKSPDIHHILDLNYYKNAKQTMEAKLGFRPTYVYFSDDIPWVTKNFNLVDSDIIIQCDKDYEEFAVMQQCDHFIIANSSFSWWASWLSQKSIQNKIVIAPTKWFASKGPQDWYDIYPQNYIVMQEPIKDNYIEIRHKDWRDFLDIKDDMSFKRINVPESGIIFVPSSNDVIYLWNHKPAETNLKILQGNLEDLQTKQENFIDSIISIKDTKNPHTIFISDNEIPNFTLKNFNINYLQLPEAHKKAHKVTLSHLYLIKYAKQNNLPYIAISDSSIIFKNPDKLTQVFDILNKNLSEWQIFTGLAHPHSKDTTFINKSFDEFYTIHGNRFRDFTVYNSNVYDKILNYNFKESYENFLAYKFVQHFYKSELIVSKFNMRNDYYSGILKNIKIDQISKENLNKLTNSTEHFFLGMITCNKYIEKRKQQDLSKCPLTYRYFIGNPTLQEAIEDKEEKIVYLPCPDSYEALPQKVYHMLKWVTNNYPKVSYIIKADDDVKFNFNNFRKYSRELIYKNIDYAGYKVKIKECWGTCHLGKCDDKILSGTKVLIPKSEFCAGPCYFVSRKSIDIILNKLFEKNTIYEDQSIGHCLGMYGIKPTHLKIKNDFSKWE